MCELGFELCGARLREGVCLITRCPPEGGRYKKAPIASSHTDSEAAPQGARGRERIRGEPTPSGAVLSKKCRRCIRPVVSFHRESLTLSKMELALAIALHVFFLCASKG